MIDSCSDDVSASVAALRARCAGRVPALALLLGTGWSALGERLENALDLPYAQLPAFPAVSVAGHAGQVRIGRLAGRELLVLCGRAHAYEDGRCDAMRGAIDTLAAAGVKVLVQTNAAGSLVPSMAPGSLMLVADHLNMAQASPLVGARGLRRFVDLVDAYDSALRRQARAAAEAAGLVLHEGVYAWMLGPMFETPAEIRMLQTLGAQAVGMSTVPETILARHAGLRVLALSMITNMGCGLSGESLSHAHTLAAAQRASEHACQLALALLARLDPAA